MTDSFTRGRSRGMTGIGVLILFIALVLVAAIAAGLILDTAGQLQNTAQDTGEQSTAEVSNRISILSASGDVTDNERIGKLRLTVYRSPGASDIDLQQATIEYFSPYGTAFLIHEAEFAKLEGDDESLETFTEELGTFTVEALKDSEGSIPVLDERSDRASVVIPLYDASETGSTDSSSSDEQISSGRPEAVRKLEPSDSATIRITTQEGATSMYIVNVPESLAGSAGGSVLL